MHNEDTDIDIQEEDVVYGVIVTEPIMRLLRKIARDLRFNTEHILELEELMTKFSVYQEGVDSSLAGILAAVNAQAANVKSLLVAAVNGDIPGIDENIASLNTSRASILEAIAGLTSTVASPTEPIVLPEPTPEVPLPELVLPEPVREVPTAVPEAASFSPAPEGVGVPGGINLG